MPSCCCWRACIANSCLWVFMCFLQFTDVLKVFWQYGHMNGLTSLQGRTQMYIFNINITDIRDYVVSTVTYTQYHIGYSYYHCEDKYLWVDICRLRLPLVVNVVSHNRHLYALTPVCVLMWAFNTPLDTNDLRHCKHLYGFSPTKKLK